MVYQRFGPAPFDIFLKLVFQNLARLLTQMTITYSVWGDLLLTSFRQYLEAPDTNHSSKECRSTSTAPTLPAEIMPRGGWRVTSSIWLEATTHNLMTMTPLLSVLTLLYNLAESKCVTQLCWHMSACRSGLPTYPRAYQWAYWNTMCRPSMSSTDSEVCPQGEVHRWCHRCCCLETLQAVPWARGPFLGA